MQDREMIQRCGWPACKAACCLHGVWVDLTERDRILEHAEKIAVQLPGERRDPATWFLAQPEEDPHLPSGVVVQTNVLKDEDHYGGTSCIFLRPDHKCALQTAGEQSGLHPWYLKPTYCVLHPLDITDQSGITLDKRAAMIDEHASCVRAGGEVRLNELFAEELDYLVGNDN